MDNAIAWPALIVGTLLALASASGLVTVRLMSSQRTAANRSWLAPITSLLLSLLLLAGFLLALWALNLRGTLGR
jgi:hypothetical protein